MSKQPPYPTEWTHSGYPVPNPHFPPTPRSRVPGLESSIALFLVGSGLMFGDIYLLVEGFIGWQLFAAGNFCGLLLLGYGTKSLRDRFSVRGLWRHGKIVPALVIGQARMPYVGVIAFSVILAALINLHLLFELSTTYLVVIAVVCPLLERVNRRFNSVQVYFEEDGEGLYARLPVNSLWRSLEVGDAVWVATRNKRAAVLHLAADIEPEEVMADDEAGEWIADRAEKFVEDNED